MSLARRRLLGAAACGAALPLVPTGARAQFRVDISGVGATQLPIALPRLGGEEALGALATEILRSDLERSGLFRIIDPGTALDESATPDYAALRGQGADALAAGSVARVGQTIELRYRVWDVVKQQALVQSKLIGQAEPISQRLLAHHAADAIHQALSGQRGPFASRIAYVSRSGGRHTLWVAHSDGEAAQEVLTRGQPIISPAWSPDGRALAYVSFERGKAEVYVHTLASGARQAIAAFRGSNSAPSWSPDGRQLAVTLSQDGGSQLYLIGRDGGAPRRLAQSSAIDTEAVWAPDGKSLYFVSDRGGAPQIYRVGTGGEGTQRISFDGSYNISPAVSPDGKMLSYVTRSNGDFRVVLQPLADGAVTPLTSTRDDENPSFAPNGRLILYATRAAGRDVLMTTTLDGATQMRVAAGRGDLREPAWGPYL